MVYCRLDEELGLDREVLRRRLARGAGVEIRHPDEGDLATIDELLTGYHRELLRSHQDEEADWVAEVIAGSRDTFVKIVPEKQTVMPKSTE